MIEMNEAETLSQDIATTQITRVARRSATILKIAAGVIAVGAIVNGWIFATTDQNQFYGGPTTDFPFKWKLQQFLNSTLWNLGLAALILAAAFAVEIVGLRAARLTAASTEPNPAPAPSVPAAPENFAAIQAPVPPSANTPPPMKIANDEDIWRR